MLARSIESDAAGPASQHPPPLEHEHRREESYPQRGAASRHARAWGPQFAALPYHLRALLGVLYVFAEQTDGPAVVRVSKATLAARTGYSRRGVDAPLEELAELVPGFVILRSDRRAHVYRLPPLLADETAARRPSMLGAWQSGMDDVTTLERAVWGVLLARGGGIDRARGAWPSAGAVAQELGVCRASVFVAFDRLERLRGIMQTRRLWRGARLPNGDIVSKGGALRFVATSHTSPRAGQHGSPALSNSTEAHLMRSSQTGREREFPSEVPPAIPGLYPPQILDSTPRNSWTPPPADPGPDLRSVETTFQAGGERPGRSSRDVDAVLEHFASRHAKDRPPRSFVADPERRRLVVARLATYSVDELRRAADNLGLSGRWDQYWSTHRRVACVYRDGDTVDELLELRPLPKARPTVAAAAVVAEEPRKPLTREERLAQSLALETVFGVPSRMTT